MSTLKARMQSYIDRCNYQLHDRLPIIISVNGRMFSKTTSLLDKPYDIKFQNAMQFVMVKLCSNIQGVSFAYCFNDEILLVLRNDQINDSFYCDNRIQKITSLCASIATLEFNKNIISNEIPMIGDPIFTTQVFSLPNIREVINALIYKQQHNFYISMQFACFYELIKKYDKNKIKDMLDGLTIDEKILLLKEECNVDFNDYPDPFRYGFAIYKQFLNGKNKFVVNYNLPIFTKDTQFLEEIFYE